VAGENLVSIDKDFARFGSKSYAINKINSVEVRRRHPHGQGMMFVCGLLTLISALSASGDAGATMWVFSALLAGLTYWFWRRSRIWEYQLFLMTSSSQAQAFYSRNPREIDQLRDRIEQAMTGQLTT
jgi:hypothetical protein